MNYKSPTLSIRRARLHEGGHIERKRSKGRHHVSQACDQCRSRKRACSAAQVLPCNECGNEHEFCERCIQENVHCHFPPPEADGRRTSNKQLVTELESKLADRDEQVATLTRQNQALQQMVCRLGGNPAEALASSPSGLRVNIPEQSYPSDASEYSTSPVLTSSAGSSTSFQSVSPQSAAPDSAAFLDVPQRRLRSVSCSHVKSEPPLLASPSIEPRYALSANCSPVPQMRDLALGSPVFPLHALTHARAFSQPEMDLSSFSVSAYNHAMSQQQHFGGGGVAALGLDLPTVSVQVYGDPNTQFMQESNVLDLDWDVPAFLGAAQ